MLQQQPTDVIDLPADIEKGEKALEALKGLSFDDAISKIANSIIDFSFRLLIAILIFYIGKLLIRKIYKTVFRMMVNRRIDASLTTFVLSLVRMVMYFILIITIIGILGIETSSFLALFASAGVAIGMALSGTLQNFAGGVLILLLKPYKVGDFIEAQGYSGKVKEIQIFHTVINTVDNKAIIIPNGGLSTSSINNYSLESYRRVDWTVSLSYDTDYDKAAAKIMEMIRSDDRVVEKYIDDDRARREEIDKEEREREMILEIKAGVAPEEKKLSWWKRIRLSRRIHQQKIQEALNAKISLSSGLPVKADCSPFVGLGELADSSINITVRAWTQSRFYWDLYFDMNRRFYKELPEAGFSFPFPQMDVHLSHQSQLNS